MVKISQLSREEFDKSKAETTRAGRWKDLLEAVKKDGVPRKVEELTRGQISAIYRKATDEGLDTRTSYKNGWILVAPIAPLKKIANSSKGAKETEAALVAREAVKG